MNVLDKTYGKCILNRQKGKKKEKTNLATTLRIYARSQCAVWMFDKSL